MSPAGAALLALILLLIPVGLAIHFQTEPSGGTFSFRSKGGNEWWLHAEVTASRGACLPVIVEARDDGGEWKRLERPSWGNCATRTGSFHIEPGHRVTLRARLADQAAWTESCPFTHPQGVEECGDGGAFDASFAGASGNEWWIQVRVTATAPVRAVDAQIDGGGWKPLTQRSFGWAASHHAPEGSIVRFRATSTTGAQDLSGCYRWTSASPAECPGSATWPREGSHVKYTVEGGMGVPDYSEHYWANVTYTFRAGAWTSQCQRHDVVEAYGNPPEHSHSTVTTFQAPPMNRRDPAPGSYVKGHGLQGCSPTEVELYARPDSSIAIRFQGRTHTLGAHVANQSEEASAYSDHHEYWDQDVGLVLSWEHLYLRSGHRGHLVDTDAPLGPRLTAQEQRGMTGPWPVEGSYVEYFWCESGSCYPENANWRFEYHSATGWTAQCYGSDDDRVVQFAGALQPPRGPLAPTRGSHPYVDRLGPCTKTTTQVKVVDTYPHYVSSPDVPRQIEVWWADEPSWSDKDKDAWWDVDSGLLIEMEYAGQRVWLTASDRNFV